jgi:hypothetical protein
MTFSAEPDVFFVSVQDSKATLLRRTGLAGASESFKRQPFSRGTAWR